MNGKLANAPKHVAVELELMSGNRILQQTMAAKNAVDPQKLLKAVIFKNVQVCSII